MRYFVIVFLLLTTIYAYIDKTYYPDGSLKIETPYKNNLKDGIEKYYYENGKLRYEVFVKNGKLNGIQKVYYENGKLQGEIPYKNGKVDGYNTPRKIYRKNRILIPEKLK